MVSRPLWAELIIALLGLALLIFTPLNVSWIGFLLVLIAIFSTLATLVFRKLDSKWQALLFLLGALLTAAGLWYGIRHDAEPEFFGLTDIFIPGLGLVFSSLVTLSYRGLSHTSDQ